MCIRDRNCAAKIERKLSKLPELSDVSVTFATKQLRFAAEDPEAVLPKIRETIQSMDCLLYTSFFYRFMPDLIHQGHVYLATPPLYKAIPKRGKEEYLYDDRALEDVYKRQCLRVMKTHISVKYMIMI